MVNNELLITSRPENRLEMTNFFWKNNVLSTRRVNKESTKKEPSIHQIPLYEFTEGEIKFETLNKAARGELIELLQKYKGMFARANEEELMLEVMKNWEVETLNETTQNI